MQRTVVIYHQGSIVAGALWMLFISLLLCWLPVGGPLIAGFVGVRKAGSAGAGILAVFLPGFIISMFCFVFATALTGIPLIGMVAGAGGFILSASGVGLLLLGAVIGGLSQADITHHSVER